jgi:hypothetical protein
MGFFEIYNHDSLMVEVSREEIIKRVDPRYMTETFILRMKLSDHMRVRPMKASHKQAMIEFNKKFKDIRKDKENLLCSSSREDFMTGEIYYDIRIKTPESIIIYIIGSDAIMILNNDIKSPIVFVLNDDEYLEIHGGGYK